MAIFFEDVFNDVFGSTGTTFKKSLAFKYPVISGQAATTTLTAAQSGSVVLFDSAAGIVYTLPTPTVGINFTFVTTVSVTSNAYEVVVANETNTFMLGGVSVGVAAGTSSVFFGNGTSHVEVTSNGTTTGGLVGSYYTVTCVSATLWQAEGFLSGSGTVATPFSV